MKDPQETVRLFLQMLELLEEVNQGKIAFGNKQFGDIVEKLTTAILEDSKLKESVNDLDGKVQEMLLQKAWNEGELN